MVRRPVRRAVPRRVVLPPSTSEIVVMTVFCLIAFFGLIVPGFLLVMGLL